MDAAGGYSCHLATSLESAPLIHLTTRYLTLLTPSSVKLNFSGGTGMQYMENILFNKNYDKRPLILREFF